MKTYEFYYKKDLIGEYDIDAIDTSFFVGEKVRINGVNYTIVDTITNLDTLAIEFKVTKL